MVEITVASGLGPSNRNVTFQSNSDLENEVYKKIEEVLGDSCTPNVLLEAIKRCPKLENSDSCLSSLIDECMKIAEKEKHEKNPFFGPEKQSTGTDASMAVVPFVHADKIAEVDTDLQKAIHESMSTQSPNFSEQFASMNLEEMIRNPNLSTGLSNSGNTCWFNCLVQILYSLPKFRSVIYHCAPATWTAEEIVNTRQDDVPFAELLLGFRRLFAELHFAEASFISAGGLLKIVDTLYRKNRPNSLSTIGTQQDATEMLILIFEWLETALNAAVQAHLHPEVKIEALEENIVVAESTTEAPNSEMAGTAPPDYSFAGDSGTVVKRDAHSRPNSPVARQSPEFTMPSTPSGSRVKNELTAITEAMDTSEGDPRAAYSPPIPAKMARIPLPTDSPAVVALPTEALVNLVDELKENFQKLFMAKLYSTTVSDENKITSETVTKNCPQIFQLQISYGNLHDALEACTYDTGRNAVSHVKNLYEELPAVIFMGLSRFVYENGASKKLYDSFKFPRNLFMDRYLKSNDAVVQVIREERLELREKLATARAKRKGISKYPHDNKEARLIDIFETTIAAMKNSRESEGPSGIVTFVGPWAPSFYFDENPSQFVRDLGKLFPEFPDFPAIASAIGTLETLKEELENAESLYQEKEKELELRIENIYDVDDLQKHNYELRAMIVHSGEASQGHYWAYRHKKSIDGTEFWEKLNDAKTDKVPWSTVEEDAFGNGLSHSPSAYLLMYVRSDAAWLDAADSLTTQEALEQLPIDLSDYVDRQQKSWKKNLQDYRDRKEAANIEGKDFLFGAKQDENANPETAYQRELETPLNDEGLLFLEREMGEVEKTKDLFWNFIVKVEPHRFSCPEDILVHHLKMAMIKNCKALPFLENLLSYPLNELSENAENDVEQVYHQFIRTYTNDALRTGKSSHVTNLVLFTKTAFEGLFPSVVRFMLVKALSLCDVGPIAKRAQRELDALSETSMKRSIAIGSLMAELYEVGNIVAFASRRTLSYCYHFQGKNPKVEDLYMAMCYARLARVCSDMLLRDANFLSPGTAVFVSAEILRTATVLVLIRLMKVLLEQISEAFKKMEELEFLLPENERRVPIETIVKEVEVELRRLYAWYCKSCERLASSEKIATEEEVNVKTIYGVLNGCVEVVFAIEKVHRDPTKLKCIKKIREAIRSGLDSDNQLPADLGHVAPEWINDEIEKVEQLFGQAIPLKDILEFYVREFEHIVGKVFS